MTTITKQRLLKTLEYSTPALIALGIFLIAMLVSWVYPMGNRPLGYIDFIAQTVPQYTGLWDILHGNTSPAIDWNLGGGGSTITLLLGSGFLSPLSWLIALFPREQIMLGISFLYLIRIMLLATTAYICFRKLFPNLNKYMSLLFTILWTFSGWFFVHYTFPSWLDMMTLFPLLILALRKLVNENKSLWFIIILTSMLLISYYLTYMILVAVVAIGLIYVIMLAKNKKQLASTLFFSIIISILISAVAFIPSCIISLGSHRFADTTTAGAAAALFDPTFSKLAIILLTPIPLYYFIRLLCTYKADKKNVLFFIIAFITISIGILIEPINAMWHTGSYFSFPFRYSFIIIMFMIIASLYYLNNRQNAPQMYKTTTAETTSTPPLQTTETTQEENTKKITEKPAKNKQKFTFSNPLLIALAITFAAFAIIFSVIYAVWAMLDHPYHFIHASTFSIILLLSIFSILTIFMIELIRSKNKHLKQILISSFALVQTIILVCGFVGLPLQQVGQAHIITNMQNLPSTEITTPYKLKDRENILGENFAQIAQVPTLQTWIHINPDSQFCAYDLLGYNHQNSTPLYSGGGTILTDVLLGNKYVTSLEKLDPRYYEEIATYDYYYTEIINEKAELIKTKAYLYQLKLTFNQVFTTNTNLNTLFESGKDYDALEVQNTLYKALFTRADDIITKAPAPNLNITENDKNYVISITPKADFITYLHLNGKGKTFSAQINDYNRNFMFGFNDLGITSTPITIELDKEKYNRLDLEILKNSLTLTYFDIETFRLVNNVVNLSSMEFNGASLEISINNTTHEKYAFVPQTYLKNMVTTVNNETGTLSTALLGFMQVELQNGQNEITITYKPSLVLPCLIITIVSLLILIAFVILNRFFKIKSNKYVVIAGTVGACLILAIVALLVFLKPLLDFFLQLFS